MDDVAGMFSVDDYLYFYGDYLTPERSAAETAAVVRLLEIDRPMRILDVACGFGRIANRLALLGHTVTGVEYLPGFLDIARHEARLNRLQVTYRQGDMRALAEPPTYDRALMMFNSFGYFPDDENLLVLQGIARALLPGGLLGFDVAHRDGVLNDFHPHYVTEKGADLLINRFSFDVTTGRLHNHRIVIRDGERRDRPFSIRLYSLTEMRALLAAAGLELAAHYAEWDASPLDFASPSMVIVARKPA